MACRRPFGNMFINKSAVLSDEDDELEQLSSCSSDFRDHGTPQEQENVNIIDCSAIVDFDKLVPIADVTDDDLIRTLNEIEKNTPQTKTRFPKINEKEMEALENSASSTGTKKQTKWAVNLFRHWLSDNGYDADFESCKPEDLDVRLRGFYAAARSADGEYYSKSAYVGIRAAINRHLRSPPYCIPFSIIDDGRFNKANTMFKAVLKKMKREGHDKTKHHNAISNADLQKLRDSPALSPDNPKSLQRKVWFDLTINFARRGMENLRELKADAFLFKEDESGQQYVEMQYNEATKNHPGDNLKDHDFEKKPRMYANGQIFCPVNSLQKYLSKRNQTNNIFFQQPKSKLNGSDNEQWYTSRPLGEKTLGSMMKQLSVEAELSQIYTNHCVRATTITLLSHAGVEAREIMRISGHRNEQSIKSYNTDSSAEQKRSYSAIIQGVHKPELSASGSVLHAERAITTCNNQLIRAHGQPVGFNQTNINNNLHLSNMLPFNPAHQFQVNNSSVQVYNFFGGQT